MNALRSALASLSVCDATLAHTRLCVFGSESAPSSLRRAENGRPTSNLWHVVCGACHTAAGYRSTTLFRRLAFCLMVQIMCFDGSGVTIGNYIKNNFAPSKDQSVIQSEVTCASALVTLVVLYRPLIGWFGERGCVVVGMGMNCLYLSSFLLVVHNMTGVYVATAIASIGSVAWPAISAIKSTKCSQKDQGRVMGALSGLSIYYSRKIISS